MKKTEILVVDTNAATLDTALGLIAPEAGWHVTGALTDEKAIEKFHQIHFDRVLLADTLTGEEVRKIRKLLAHQHDGMIIAEYRTADLDRLPDRIREALAEEKAGRQPSFSVFDGAFQPKVIIQ